MLWRINQNLFILLNLINIMKKLNEHQRKIFYISIGIIILLILYALKNTSYFLRSSTFIFAVALFYFADIFFKFDFNIKHYIIVIIIATTGILLSPLYFLYPGYDKILHFISPFLLGFLVYFLLDKTKLQFSTKLIMTFSVVVMSLTLFEMVEFGVDQFFDLKLQGVYTMNKLNILMNRNDDTMMDLILGSIGNLIFVGYKTLEINYKKLIKKKK